MKGKATTNPNIYFADIINLEEINFWKWAWILIFLNFAQLAIYALQARGKVKIFGSTATGFDFICGPRSPVVESNSAEVIQGREMELVTVDQTNYLFFTRLF